MLRVYVFLLLAVASAHGQELVTVSVDTVVDIADVCTALENEALTPAGMPSPADAYRVAMRSTADTVAFPITRDQRSVVNVTLQCTPDGSGSAQKRLRIDVTLPLKTDQVAPFLAALDAAVETGSFTMTAAVYLGGDALAPSAIRYTNGYRATCVSGGGGGLATQSLSWRSAMACSPANTFTPGVTVTVFEPASKRRK